MACDPSAILNEARCDLCAIPPGLVGYVALALMCAIRDGEAMSCDPNALMEQARCLECALMPGQLAYAQLAVLCDILANSGGGGEVMQYTGASPTADGLVPTDPTQPAIAYKDDGSLPIFVWNTTTNIWQ